MAYRRPAVTVIQEFVGLQPALAAFALPSVAVGPAYQLVTDDTLGLYAAVSADYVYASKVGGAIVDLDALAVDELFPITKLPVAVRLKNAFIQIVASQTAGVASAAILTQASPSTVFDNVLAGDVVVVTASLGVDIVLANVTGTSAATPGLRNRLSNSVSGTNANVKVGDTVSVTAGTNTVFPLTATVVSKTGDTLVLDADVNDGVGASSNVAYSIIGDRGAANAGTYTVKSKDSGTQLTLSSAFVENEAPLTFYVKRLVASIDLVRDTDYTAIASKVTVNASLVYQTYPILTGEVHADYRALRIDLAANVKEFQNLTELQAFFGTTQITPANPLAYALSLMLQNTVTPVNGLGLDANGQADEVLSHQAALAVLELTEMYCLVPLTQNPAIAPMYRAHVEALSQPEAHRERVAVVNRRLITIETLQDESTTSTSLTGARTIVGTQVDGAALVAQPTHLNDATTGQFLSVAPGDSVVIVSGTNAIPGTFSVVTKTDNNNLVLSGPIVSANSTDLVYYAVRKDGLGADGMTFYDRNATFVSSGIAAGHFFRIMTGPLAGRYVIGSVPSERELVLGSAINGVTSLQAPIDYLIDRDMSKTEQANFIKGYSSSIGSRRVVNLWPDSLEAPIGQTLENVPGFFGSAVIGALTTGLPTQRGFTNLSISGFLGLAHSTGYFSDTQLDIIADGGTMILAQAGPEQPLYIRHQLTTDRSSIKFQEYSVTKNVDYIAKFIRDAYSDFPGRFNIIDTTKDELRGTAKAVLTFLKDQTRLPEIGGVIRSGNLASVEEDETQIDTVLMRFALDIPIPLNNLIITIAV